MPYTRVRSIPLTFGHCCPFSNSIAQAYIDKHAALSGMRQLPGYKNNGFYGTMFSKIGNLRRAKCRALLTLLKQHTSTNIALYFINRTLFYSPLLKL